MAWYDQSLNRQIGQRIYDGALARGIDPNLALGIATHEGLNRNDPLASNSDPSRSGSPGISFGPFQDRTPGLASSLGLSPSDSWQSNVDANLNFMRDNPGRVNATWSSISDQGGVSSITAKGAADAQRLGLDTSGNGNPIDTDPNAPTTENAPGATGGAAGGLPGALGKILGGAKSLPGIGDLAGKMGGGLTPNTDATGGQFDVGGGTPVTITDIQAAGGGKGGSGPEIQSGLNQAGSDVKATGAEADKTFTAGIKSTTDTATAITNTGADVLQNPDTGLIARFGVGMAAIVLIAMGLWMLGKQHGTAPAH